MDTTTTPSTARIALKYGLYTGLTVIIYSLILNITGLELNFFLGWFAIIFVIIGLVYALKEFRKENGGAMSFGQGMGVAALSSFIIAIALSIFTVVYSFYVDPDSRQRQLKYTIEQTENISRKFGAPESETDKAIDKIKEDFDNTGPGQTFAKTVAAMFIIYIIFSLIIAAIMKKKKDVFAQ